MSYILEALRKSEQERNPEKVPDLATHHPQITRAPRTHLAYWITGAILILINGFFIAYLMQRDTVVEQPATTVQPVMAVNSEARPAEVNNTQLSDKLPQQKSQDTAIVVEKIPESTVLADTSLLQNKNQADNQLTKEAIVDRPVNTTTEHQFINPVTANINLSELDSAAIPDIADLNYSFQQQIPDMEFTTHIYVRDGGSFIIINGKSLNEGMSISRGLRVLKIEANRIILEFKGRRFFLPSMTNWYQD